MQVELVTYTPESDKICAAAALCCHSNNSACYIYNDLTNEKKADILRKTIKMGHYSVLEHANFTFSISDVSRALTHQLVRHRIASYSQQSQRYVKLNEATFVTPPSIQSNSEALDKYKKAMESIWDSYNHLIEMGIPKEDARFILPNATTTSITVTMNARELRHFFNLRCSKSAQWEIRALAWKMLEEVKGVAPIIFEGAGPRSD